MANATQQDTDNDLAGDARDPDDDGLEDAEEAQIGTDPLQSDADGLDDSAAAVAQSLSNFCTVS